MAARLPAQAVDRCGLADSLSDPPNRSQPPPGHANGHRQLRTNYTCVIASQLEKKLQMSEGAKDVPSPTSLRQPSW